MADISIEQFKAKQWIRDVENELMQIEMILQKVSTVCTSIPGEEDDIMKGIVNTGETLRGFWNQMDNNFKQATELLAGAIEKIGVTADEVIQDINAVKSKIGN